MASYHRLNLILRSFRRGDVAGGFKTIFRLLRDRLFGQYRLLFAMTGEKAAGGAVDEAKLAVQRFESWDAMDANTRAFLDANRDKIQWDVKAHLAEGMSVWIGQHEGRPTTIAQTRAGQNVRFYFFPMTEACALISHCYTAPEARGRGLYVEILRQVSRQLAQGGFTRLYIDCSDSNASSERGILSAGFLPIGRGQHRRDGTIHWRQETVPSVARLEQEAVSKRG